MKNRYRILATSLLAVAASLALTVSSFAAGAPRVIKITGTDDMRFSLTRIEVMAGESIKIQLLGKGNQPKDAMAHNWVLLAPGVDMGAFITQATMARAAGYIPAAFKAKILAATKLAGAGETVEVTFTAPATPGNYPYVCTFPAHYAGGMKGSLVVKPAAAAPKK